MNFLSGTVDGDVLRLPIADVRSTIACAQRSRAVTS